MTLAVLDHRLGQRTEEAFDVGLAHEQIERQLDDLRLHVRAALAEGGFTPDDIKEILLQQAIYCGVPAANHAVKEASAVLSELGLLKG